MRATHTLPSVFGRKTREYESLACPARECSSTNWSTSARRWGSSNGPACSCLAMYNTWSSAQSCTDAWSVRRAAPSAARRPCSSARSAAASWAASSACARDAAADEGGEGSVVVCATWMCKCSTRCTRLRQAAEHASRAWRHSPANIREEEAGPCDTARSAWATPRRLRTAIGRNVWMFASSVVLLLHPFLNSAPAWREGRDACASLPTTPTAPE